MIEMTTSEENLRFLQLCQSNRVGFLLIGGAAVAFHRCREEEGFDDIDLMPDPSKENAERLMRVFKLAGVTTDKFTAEDVQQPNTRITLKAPDYTYNLDILTPWAEWSYSEMEYRSELGRLGPLEVWILSKADLIRTKENVLAFLESEAGKLTQKSMEQAEKIRKDLRCLKGERE